MLISYSGYLEGINSVIIKKLQGKGISFEKGLGNLTSDFHIYFSLWDPFSDLSFSEQELYNLNNLEKIIKNNRSFKNLVVISSVLALGNSGHSIANEKTAFQDRYLNTLQETLAKSRQIIIDSFKKANFCIFYNSFPFGQEIIFENHPIFKAFLSSEEKIKEDILSSNSETLFNWLYLDDLISLLFKILKEGKFKAGEYIIGGQNASWSEILEEILYIKKQGYISKKESEGNLFEDTIKQYSENFWAYSVRKAQQDLGYEPTPLHIGLKKIAEWLVQEGYLNFQEPKEVFKKSKSCREISSQKSL